MTKSLATGLAAGTPGEAIFSGGGWTLLLLKLVTLVVELLLEVEAGIDVEERLKIGGILILLVLGGAIAVEVAGGAAPLLLIVVVVVGAEEYFKGLLGGDGRRGERGNTVGRSPVAVAASSRELAGDEDKDPKELEPGSIAISRFVRGGEVLLTRG